MQPSGSESGMSGMAKQAMLGSSATITCRSWRFLWFPSSSIILVHLGSADCNLVVDERQRSHYHPKAELTEMAAAAATLCCHHETLGRIHAQPRHLFSVLHAATSATGCYLSSPHIMADRVFGPAFEPENKGLMAWKIIRLLDS